MTCGYGNEEAKIPCLHVYKCLKDVKDIWDYFYTNDIQNKCTIPDS